MLEKFKKNLTPYEAGIIQALGDAAITIGEMASDAAIKGRPECWLYSKVYGYIVDQFFLTCGNITKPDIFREPWDYTVEDREEIEQHLCDATAGYLEGVSQTISRVTWIGRLQIGAVQGKVLSDATVLILDALTDENHIGIPFMGGKEEKAHLTGWAEAYKYATQRLNCLEGDAQE